MSKARKITGSTNPWDKTFPRRLTKLLDRPGETQAKLANAVGVSRQAISQWQNGNTSPDVNSLTAIADYFGVPADYLLYEDRSASLDVTVQAIHEKTGLSDDSIKILKETWAKKETRYLLTHTIDELIQDQKLIEMVSEYLYTRMDETHELQLFTHEKDYDGTYTDVVGTYEFDDEKRKRIILLEIQSHLGEMRKSSEERRDNNGQHKS